MHTTVSQKVVHTRGEEVYKGTVHLTNLLRTVTSKRCAQLHSNAGVLVIVTHISIDAEGITLGTRILILISTVSPSSSPALVWTSLLWPASMLIFSGMTSDKNGPPLKEFLRIVHQPNDNLRKIEELVDVMHSGPYGDIAGTMSVLHGQGNGGRVDRLRKTLGYKDRCKETTKLQPHSVQNNPKPYRANMDDSQETDYDPSSKKAPG